MAGKRKRAVFIDRDGTLNEMVYDEVHGILDSPRRPEQVRLMAHAADFVSGVKALGYLAIVVTNQPGLAKGTLTSADLESVNRRLADLLASEGAAWDDLRCCPHHPAGGPFGRPDLVQECSCRKPNPGMLLEAAEEHGIDLAASWMVGDGFTDVQAGRAAGCRTILLAKVKVMHLERFFDMKEYEPDAVAPDLKAALRLISEAANH